MDASFPTVRQSPRRGRSYHGYTFTREAMGAPIRSNPPLSWVDCLIEQSFVRVYREDHDPVYRGDVRLQDSCAGVPAARLPEDSDESDEPDELSDTDTDTDTSDESGKATRGSSPATAPSAAAGAAEERLSSPQTPSSRSAPVTYSWRDHKRGLALVLRRAEQAAAAKREAAKRRHRLRAERGPPRRSRRLRRARMVRAEDLINDGYPLHRLNTLPRPVIDRQNYVVAVVAGGPKGQLPWWNDVHHTVFKTIARLDRNKAAFCVLGAESSSIRFGIGYGEEFAGPHGIAHEEALAHEIYLLGCSEAFRAMSDYQNHLYQQVAPRGHALVAAKVKELIDRGIAYPAFEHSVFTTSVISFCDVPMESRKNFEAAYDTMEAVTSIGDYDHVHGGHIVSLDGEGLIEFPPGSTALFPSGTQRYAFVAVGAQESRYLFRQYCNASVLRWVEKGGRSDTEWEISMTAEELEEWKVTRASRGKASLKSFTKLGEVYVF